MHEDERNLAVVLADEVKRRAELAQWQPRPLEQCLERPWERTFLSQYEKLPKVKSRFSPGDALGACVNLAFEVCGLLNDKYLTRHEIFVAWCCCEFLFEEIDKERSIAPALPADVMNRQAIEENRDLHRQLHKAKLDAQLAENSVETQRQKVAELSKENHRLRARERELVAVYRAMPYDAYLQTPHVRTTRALALERAMNRCQMCNATQESISI